MGDDTYIVDDSKDKVVEASNGGVDTIITTLNKFSLAKMPKSVHRNTCFNDFTRRFIDTSVFFYFSIFI